MDKSKASLRNFESNAHRRVPIGAVPWGGEGRPRRPKSYTER